MREPPRVLTPKDRENNGDLGNSKAEISVLTKALQMWVPALFLTSKTFQPSVVSLSLSCIVTPA